MINNLIVLPQICRCTINIKMKARVNGMNVMHVISSQKITKYEKRMVIGTLPKMISMPSYIFIVCFYYKIVKEKLRNKRYKVS